MPELPIQLLNSLATLPHFNKEDFIQAHLAENKITSLRLNPFKLCELDFSLEEAIPWHSRGFYLNSRPSFTLDPLFQAGCYYVQEPGSMFLEFALKKTLDFSKNLRVLDVCAAPGGKSTLINSLLNNGSVLVSNEIVKSRAETLSHNLSKWGTANSLVTNSDTSRFTELSGFFDAIVIDAPCSGSGLFRKQPEAIEHWSEAAVKSCSVRQQQIIDDILPALKENGILFYSTCSYSFEENEAVVEYMIHQHEMELISLNPSDSWGIVETQAGYRFYPHLCKTEGFFCSVLRKKTSESAINFPVKKNRSEVSKFEKAIIEPLLILETNEIVKVNERFHFMNEAAQLFLNTFSKQFYFKKAGVLVGEIKGKDLVPNHELAMSTSLSRNVNCVDLDRETALKFLRKEALKVEQQVKGFSLISYKKMGLGWAKILPNRFNNYLPNEYRILK